MQEPARSPSIWIGACLATALGLGLRAMAPAVAEELGIEEARYLVAAHHLRSGVGYSDWNGPEIDIQPLHPGLTALMGSDPATLEFRGRLVACLAACASLLIIGRLVWRVAGRGPAVFCLLMVGTNPWLVREAGCPQPESLYVAFVGGAVLVLAGLPDRSRAAWRWLGAGILFGLAYLARPEGILMAPLAAVLALLDWRVSSISRVGALGLFCLALIAVSSPHLLFLRQATGEWVITGKSEKVFFIGQAMHAAGGQPPMRDAYLALEGRYGGILPFVMERPLDLLLRVARFTARVWLSIVPRGLGLVGLAGWALYLLSARTRRWFRKRALVLVPAAALLLIPLAWPEERVIATTLPFMLIPAAEGLAALRETWGRAKPRRMQPFWLLVGALLIAAWVPSLRRVVLLGDLARHRVQGTAIRRAVALAGDPALISSNNPAISFLAGDPSILGPSGRYRPLDPGLSCASLEAELQGRGASVAILDRSFDPLGRDVAVTPGCRLQEILRLARVDGAGMLRVLALPP